LIFNSVDEGCTLNRPLPIGPLNIRPSVRVGNDMSTERNGNVFFPKKEIEGCGGRRHAAYVPNFNAWWIRQDLRRRWGLAEPAAAEEGAEFSADEESKIFIKRKGKLEGHIFHPPLGRGAPNRPTPTRLPNVPPSLRVEYIFSKTENEKFGGPIFHPPPRRVAGGRRHAAWLP
jgi:hypothetical protein